MFFFLLCNGVVYCTGGAAAVAWWWLSPFPSDPYRCKDFFGGKYVLLCVGITASAAAAAVATAWGLTRQRAKNPRLTDYTDDSEAIC